MSTTVTLFPEADCSVCLANPTTNFGSDPKLKVGLDPDTGNLYRSFVRFNLSVIPVGKVILSANLRFDPFYSGNGDYGDSNFDVQQCIDLTWGQNSITWNNSPNASVLADVARQWQQQGPAGGLGWQELDISAQVSAALAAGGIGFRIKNSLESQPCYAWVSKKSFTPTECSQLVITYADAGTTQGWLDIPMVDAFIEGTYTSDVNPPSQGFRVVTDSNLYIYNSSSSGRNIDQSFLYANTALSVLQGLGLPVGESIFKREVRAFCKTPWQIGQWGDTCLRINTSGTYGATVTLDDWDLVSGSVVRDVCNDFVATGWKIWNLDTFGINLSGWTNLCIKPGAYGSNGDYAIMASSRDTNGHAPVLRIYYTYEVVPALAPQLAMTGMGVG